MYIREDVKVIRKIYGKITKKLNIFTCIVRLCKITYIIRVIFFNRLPILFTILYILLLPVPWRFYDISIEHCIHLPRRLFSMLVKKMLST